MSEATATALAARLNGEDVLPANTDPIVDEDESQEEELESTEESTEEEAPAEEQEAEELPDSVKEILSKNRKELRSAKARATAAEKALAAKASEAGEPVDTRFKELYLKSAAKTALVEAGVSTGTDRFLKMLDLSEVEVDDSGAISGLEEQIADLKEDFADLFAPKPVKKTVGKVDGSRREAAQVPMTTAQKHAAALGL